MISVSLIVIFSRFWFCIHRKLSLGRKRKLIKACAVAKNVN